MTTKADVFAQIESARNVALSVLASVRGKRDALFLSPTLWWAIPEADGYVENAARSVATIELLPEILEEALVSQDVGTALAQALVIVEKTGDSTERYAEWAQSSALVLLVKETWSVLVEIIADLAYEVANAILVIGKRAAEGAGWQGMAALAALAVIGGGLLLAKR
jgi:hypothetical protein